MNLGSVPLTRRIRRSSSLSSIFPQQSVETREIKLSYGKEEEFERFHASQQITLLKLELIMKDLELQSKSDLEQEIEDVKADKERLRAKLNSLKETYREVEEAYPTYAGLVMENCRIKMELVKLQSQLESHVDEEREWIINQMKTEREKDVAVSKLIELKSTGFSELYGLYERVRSQRESIINLEQEKEELSSELDEANLKLEGKVEEQRQLEAKKAQVIEKCHKRNVELYQENVEFYTNTKELKNLLKQVEKVNKEMMTEKAEQLTKLIAEGEKVKALKKSLQEREDEKKFFKNRSEEAASQVVKLTEMNGALEGKIEGLKGKLLELKMEVYLKNAEARYRRLLKEKESKGIPLKRKLNEGFEGKRIKMSAKTTVVDLD